MKNVEYVMQQVKTNAADNRGTQFAVISKGVARRVVQMLLDGKSLISIVEHLDHDLGVSITAKAIGRFRRRFVNPVKTLSPTTQAHLLAFEKRISVLDCLAELIGMQKAVAKMEFEREEAIGRPLRTGNAARRALLKSLSTYADVERKLDSAMIAVRLQRRQAVQTPER